MSVFDDYFARMAPDAEVWFARHGTRDAEGWTFDRRTEPHPLDAAAVSAMSVRKLSACIEVPDELLMDLGVIPDTRPPRPPPTRRQRIRSKVSDWRERTARRAYKIIAGYWPDGGEDW